MPVIPFSIGWAWTKPATVDFGTDHHRWSMGFAVVYIIDFGSIVKPCGKTVCHPHDYLLGTLLTAVAVVNSRF
jgi:hypothetical protein